jgi:hypothetical protein
MERLVERLRTTGDQLGRQGVSFVMETRDAGRGFIDHTLEAAASAVSRTRDAGGSVVATVRSEAEAWKGFLDNHRSQVSQGVRHWVSIRTLEYRLLSTVHKGLSELDGQLEGRLKELSTTAAPELSPSKPKRLPIGNYDSLTAKEVVSRLDRLSSGQVQAVYEHERRQKQRQTVLRAAKQRMAN